MTFNKKACLFAALILTLTQIFSLVSFADDGENVKWMLSADRQLLMGYGGKTYYQTEITSDIYIDPQLVIEYDNEVVTGTVYSASEDPEVVWIENEYGELTLYATESASVNIKKFEGGKYQGYRIWDYSSSYTRKCALLDKSVVEQMNAAGVTTVATVVTVGVAMIKNMPYYEITSFDPSGVFARDIGRVFADADGKLYYVCYANLDNSYFDADGNLSYRSGAITLTVLEGTAEATVTQATANMVTYDVEYQEEGADADAVSVFWVFFVFGGILLPIAFIVAGCVLATSDKRGRPKYWYSIAIVAALIMLTCFVLMGILL